MPCCGDARFGKQGRCAHTCYFCVAGGPQKCLLGSSPNFGDTLGTEFYYRHPRSYARRAIFSIDEPSPTIRGVNRPIPKTYQVHPNDACHDLSKVRPLTTIERSQIQTFPRSFVLTGKKADIEQAIGNAVPVNLAKYVAECLKEYISKR